jgi:hypothetical protein
MVRGDRIDVLRSRQGTDESGDGTVPRVSATPIEAGETQAAFAVARHGALQNVDAVLAHVQGVLTTPRALGHIRAVGAPITLSIDIDDVFTHQEPVLFAVRPSQVGIALEAVIESVSDASSRQVFALAPSDEWLRREVPPLPSRVYRITVTGDPTEVEPVSEIFTVAGARPTSTTSTVRRCS